MKSADGQIHRRLVHSEPFPIRITSNESLPQSVVCAVIAIVACACCRSTWRSRQILRLHNRRLTNASASSTAAPEAPAPAQRPAAAPPTLAQQMQQAQQQAVAPPQPFYVPMPHSHNPFAPYRPSTAPDLNLNNSPRLQNLIRDGKLYISLHDAIALAIENNLDLAYFRYNFPIAQTDIQRTKAGSPANGVNTAIVQSSRRAVSPASTGGGGGHPDPVLSRRGRYRHIDARRRHRGFVLRSLPHLQGLCRSHRHPGGQSVSDRRADSEDTTPLRACRTSPSRFPWAPMFRSTTRASVMPATPLQRHQSRAVFQVLQ